MARLPCRWSLDNFWFDPPSQDEVPCDVCREMLHPHGLASHRGGEKCLQNAVRLISHLQSNPNAPVTTQKNDAPKASPKSTPKITEGDHVSQDEILHPVQDIQERLTTAGNELRARTIP